MVKFILFTSVYDVDYHNSVFCKDELLNSWFDRPTNTSDVRI